MRQLPRLAPRSACTKRLPYNASGRPGPKDPKSHRVPPRDHATARPSETFCRPGKRSSSVLCCLSKRSLGALAFAAPRKLWQ